MKTDMRIYDIRRALARTHRPCRKCHSARAVCTTCGHMWCLQCNPTGCTWCKTHGTEVPVVGTRNSALPATDSPPEKYVRPSRRQDVRRQDRRSHPDIHVPNELMGFVTAARGSGIVVKRIDPSNAKMYLGAKYEIELFAPPGITTDDSVIHDMIDSTPLKRMAMSSQTNKKGTIIAIRLGVKTKQPVVSDEDQAVIDMMNRKRKE